VVNIVLHGLLLPYSARRVAVAFAYTKDHAETDPNGPAIINVHRFAIPKSNLEKEVIVLEPAWNWAESMGG
jgi:hypothetical protein